MQCDDFLQKMHECLDQRIPLGVDPDMAKHAGKCDDCSSQVQIWMKIAPLLTSDFAQDNDARAVAPNVFAKRKYTLISVFSAAMAAVFLFAVVGFLPTKPANQPIIAGASVSSTALAQTPGELDPVLWWQSVQDRDWVQETMPTVRSVRQGVAPLGRTLVRAVTILTIGGEGQTS